MTDTVVINSASTSEAPEGHEQAMIDLVDKSAEIPEENLDNPAEGNTDTEERPQWLPEKFKTPEDMAKAYQELESKLGKGEPKGETPPPAEATEDDATKALSEKGLDFSEFSAEFAEKGELSPESYDKLQKAGIPKDMVDQYIEGQRARATQYDSTIKSEVGGDDKYTEMVTWAASNMTPEEITAFNTAVSSGDINQARLAVLGLSAQYAKANGTEPNRMVGGGKASGEDVFESTSQITEAMRDPRYKNDPAYRSKVQAKLARSNVF